MTMLYLKRNIARLAALYLVGVAAAIAQPMDTLWVKSYFNDGGDFCRYITVMGDSVLMVGKRGLEGGYVNPMILWIDYDGNFIDSTVVVTPDLRDYVTDAILTPQNTLVLCGIIDEEGPYKTGFITEITLDGEIEWYHILEYPGAITQELNAVCRTQDGNYAFVGFARIPEEPLWEDRYWVVWRTPEGEQIDQQVYDMGFNLFNQVGECITATHDNGLVICGTAYSDRPDLFKLDETGSEVWRTRGEECGIYC